MSKKAMELALEALENAGEAVYARGGIAAVGSLNIAAQALRKALVDADDTSQKRVDKMVKTEHDTLGSEWAECVKLPIVVHVRNQREGETHISTREGITPVLPDDLIMRGVAGEEYPIGRELFERTYTFDTASLKREWVGLTDEERHNIREWQEIQKELGPVWAPMMLYLYLAIEQALKEKNHG